MDRLTRLACDLFRAPAGLIAVLGDSFAEYRASVGLEPGWLCGEVGVTRLLVAEGAGATLVIRDALADPRTVDHPLVTGPAGARFYAGATISDRAGKPIGAIGVIDTRPRPQPSTEDLAALKRLAALAGELIDLETLRREQAEQLGLLSFAEGMAGVGRWRLDVASQRVFWSDEVYRIHGVDRAGFDPAYDDAVGFYHPEDRETVRTAVARTLETGEAYEFKLRIIRRDGEERIVLSRGACERDGSGRPSAAFGVFQDVTENETANQRLRDSEARYRMLADRATDVILTYDQDGCIDYVSPAVTTLIGYAPEDLIGLRPADLIYPEDLVAMAGPFRDFVRDPAAESLALRYRMRTRAGALRWLETRVTAVRDHTGKVVRFQDIIRDISETKRLEDDLVEARNRAEAAARAKSEFLANMSHELRTPLTSVIGFSGLLQASETLEETERAHVDRIGAASEALLCVINDILDYSKLEDDAVSLDPHAFEVRRFVNRLAALVEGQCAAKGLDLEIRVDPTVPEAVLGDEGRLRQVALNFLSNALKFTETGTIRVIVDWRPEGLRLAVKDTGIGIPADKLDAVFERFSQADTSTTRLYGGTGLGLSISRRLMNLMGGRVGVESTPGKGSTFWLEAPLSPAALQAESGYDAGAGGAGLALNVLVADDAPANRELITLLLSGVGATVRTVSDGKQAVEAARSGAYDVILMDLHMPVMDGLAATRAIRALKGAGATTPIIALSADVQPEQVEGCRRAGMQAHVGKPIQVADLFQTLVTVTEARRGRARTAAA